MVETPEVKEGVYAIINLRTLKVYVGATGNFRKRVYKHILDLNNGEHFNTDLQRDWNKFGAESFVLEVIDASPRYYNHESRYLRAAVLDGVDVYNVNGYPRSKDGWWQHFYKKGWRMYREQRIQAEIDFYRSS